MQTIIYSHAVKTSHQSDRWLRPGAARAPGYSQQLRRSMISTLNEEAHGGGQTIARATRIVLLVALLSTTVGIVAVNKADLVTSWVTFGSLTTYLLLHVAVIRHFALGSGRRAVFQHWISPVLG